MYIYQIEERLDGIYFDAEIHYTVESGEPAVRHDRNGDGYPGSAPEVEILKVVVHHAEGPTWALERADMGGWEGDLDRLILKHFDRLLDKGWWGLYDTLLANAERS